MASPSIEVPNGYKLHTENSSHILLPENNEAFLNPVQEFNRDLSVACIRMWADEQRETQHKKFLERQAKISETGGTHSKRRKVTKTETEDTIVATSETKSQEEIVDPSSNEFHPRKIVVLEALSATGLRSIRYAKEIPNIKHVLANDLSPAAVEAMQRNVNINNLGVDASSEAESAVGKVMINQGDACALMYAHRSPQARVDVVDLDPYGTAAPFIDGAVQAVRDNGLICVTCTDMAVLAGLNYPEKCFANYGGAPVKAEYCHESALRLVLHSIATAAARYGRSITPLLSLSIDFYVRLFIRVKTSPIEVKKLASQTSIFYVCTVCQSPYEQPLGKSVAKDKSTQFKTHAGPSVSETCPECASALHAAGPMWNGLLHDAEFLKRTLEHIDTNTSLYKTATRMKGMLTVASEELKTPFYFTPSRIAGLFHCEVPSLDQFASALLHAGFEVSRSHALAGSIKTTAPRSFVLDVMRGWIKDHPVKMENIKDGQVAHRLLAKDIITEMNFSRHPNSVSKSAQEKLVRYQMNPTPNWGPAKKAGKRKRDEDIEES